MWTLLRRAFALLCLAALLGGCAAPLPSLEGRKASTYIADTTDTPIGRAIHAAGPHPGTSGIHALPTPLEAYAARVLLVRSAQRSLDIQYYIWHADTTGLMLVDELRQAADRGVRVRLLLDDNGIAGMDEILSALDAHPNIEVRLFNPFMQRHFKLLGYLTDLGRVNHRMHNKSLTADSQVTIVGGRNIGDSYFGADPGLDFTDLDVLAAGPVAGQVAQAFDDYWNSTLAYPATSIIGPPGPDAQQALQERIASARTPKSAQAYVQAVRDTTFAEDLLAGKLPFDWVPVHLVYDPPEKATHLAQEEDLLPAQLRQTMGTAARELDLVSPYFVPGVAGTALLAQRSASGVQVRIITNSLAATDVTAVHAGYAKRRKDLLRAGVKLYEIKPDPEAPKTRTRGAWRRLAGSSAASLHGKTFMVDRSRLFVGSFNIDPRSMRLNTEMGLVIESPLLAGTIAEALDRELPEITYEVRIAPDGGLEWIEQTEAGEVRYRNEPKASLARRLGAGVMSWLPIEWLL